MENVLFSFHVAILKESPLVLICMHLLARHGVGVADYDATTLF